MAALGDGRGVLYPTRLPTFHRVEPPAGFREAVRWFWIPEWDIPAGRSSRQELLPFPAANLVVGPEGVSVSGPTTRVSHRDLRGKGWAVGALLRPAALPPLGIDPARILNTEEPVEAVGLHRRVEAAMQTAASAPRNGAHRERAVREFLAWLTVQGVRPDQEGRLANELEEAISNDRSVVRVDQLAERMGLSVRSVQRLSRRYFGIPPLAVIRRYRLQEAAVRMREIPELTISSVAADLGYADHAHLAGDFRRVLGMAPNAYRQESRGGSEER